MSEVWKKVAPPFVYLLTQSNYANWVRTLPSVIAPPRPQIRHYPTPAQSFPEQMIIPTSSSSSSTIEDFSIDSSGRKLTTDTLSHRTSSSHNHPVQHLSIRAQGKLPQRESSPIESTTPQPRRFKLAKTSAQLIAEAEAADDDDDLPSFKELADRKLKEEAIRALKEKKQKAIDADLMRRKNKSKIAPRTVLQVDSDDSDLEIEGAPEQVKLKFASTSTPTSTLVPSTPRYTQSELQMRERQRAIAQDPDHEDETTTDSQVALAGHTFGRHLRGQQVVLPSSSAPPKAVRVMNFQTGTTRLKKAPTAPVGIDQAALDNNLLAKASRQHAALRRAKDLNARRAHDERLQADARGEVEQAKQNAGGTITEMLARKKKELKERGEDIAMNGEDEDDDANDEDFEMEGGSDDRFSGQEDEAGSGSGDDDDPVSEKENVKPDQPDRQVLAEIDSDVAGEGALDSNKENLRMNRNEDDGDESMPVVHRRIGPRIEVVEEEEDEEEDNSPSIGSESPAPAAAALLAPGRMKLPSFMDATSDVGFSQFFGEGFSQVDGVGNGVREFHLL
jgi:hypothetical protein